VSLALRLDQDLLWFGGQRERDVTRRAEANGCVAMAAGAGSGPTPRTLAQPAVRVTFLMMSHATVASLTEPIV